MAWQVNGVPITLGGPGDILSIPGLVGKLFNVFLTNILATGTTDVHLEIDDDINQNYSSRTSFNGGADSSQPSQPTLEFDNNISAPVFWIGHLFNLTTGEKIGYYYEVREGLTGAANAPDRAEKALKWTNTSVQFTKYEHTNDEAGDFDTGSNLSALGTD